MGCGLPILVDAGTKKSAASRTITSVPYHPRDLYADRETLARLVTDVAGCIEAEAVAAT